MNLVYKHEKKLFIIVLIFSVLLWLPIVIGTLGTILLWLFIASLFIQSGLISHLKGNGVKVSEQQMPTLYKQFHDCCDTLEVDKRPELYVLNSEGFLNALATRFLRKNYVILYSGVVDALQKYPDGLNFYIGHELGHIKRRHLALSALLLPGSILPIIGPAYARSQEYTSDLHGLKCSKKPKDAVFAMAVLAMGAEQWSKLNIRAYADQSEEAGGFWMSFHELTASYPWLSKRMKHLLDKASNKESSFPKRSPLAWLFALFVPRVGFGASGLVSLMIMVSIAGILAAIALPAYQQYVDRSEMSLSEGERPNVNAPQRASVEHEQNMAETDQMRQEYAHRKRQVAVAKPLATNYKIGRAMNIAGELESLVGNHILKTKQAPRSLADIGVPTTMSTREIKQIKMTDKGFVLHLQGAPEIEGKTLFFEAVLRTPGEVEWRCSSELRIAGCNSEPVNSSV